MKTTTSKTSISELGYKLTHLLYELPFCSYTHILKLSVTVPLSLSLSLSLSFTHSLFNSLNLPLTHTFKIRFHALINSANYVWSSTLGTTVWISTFLLSHSHLCSCSLYSSVDILLSVPISDSPAFTVYLLSLALPLSHNLSRTLSKSLALPRSFTLSVTLSFTVLLAVVLLC